MKEETDFDIATIEKTLTSRGIEFNSDQVYIMPESTSDEFDLINENTPDIYKILKSAGVDAVVVKGENIKYLGLRDDSILLPLIIGIPFSILANYLTVWLQSKFSSDKEVQLEIVIRKEKIYKKIKIKGKTNDVVKIINEMKDSGK